MGSIARLSRSTWRRLGGKGTNRRHSMPDNGKMEKATAAFKKIYLIATITYWGRVQGLQEPEQVLLKSIS